MNLMQIWDFSFNIDGTKRLWLKNNLCYVNVTCIPRLWTFIIWLEPSLALIGKR